MNTAKKSELVRRYGVDDNTLYRWAKREDFPTAENKFYLIDEVDKWVLVNAGMAKTRNRLRKLRAKEKQNKPVIVLPEVAEPIEPLSNLGKSTLDVIVFLLKDDDEKQKAVLELLLD